LFFALAKTSEKLVSFSSSSVETENQNVWKPVRAEQRVMKVFSFHFSFFAKSLAAN
jgi:hypothetical protein